jgi:hypothetical protein
MGWLLQADDFSLHVITYMLIFGAKFPIKYPVHDILVSLILNFRQNLYKSSNIILFNIECYVGLFSGITPIALP